jgi:uncharacterized membrane protein YecN with MAPEG domain
MPVYPIATALTAALLAILNALLATYVGTGRYKYKTSLGDGGNDALNRRIRMHGNLAENAPLFLILLALVEMTGEHGRFVWFLGPVFVVLRLSHAVGLSDAVPRGANPFRAIGAAGTMVCQLVLAIMLIAEHL